MRIFKIYEGRNWCLLLAAGAALFVAGVQAQTVPGQIQVRGLSGSATYSMTGGVAVVLRAGEAVPVGSLVKTDTGSAVDLAFSHNAGVVRLVQNSAVSIDKFAVNTATGGAVEVQLYLMEGTMVGFEKNLSNTSRYQVKVLNGIADISGSKFRLSAQGYLVLLDGNAVFVYVPPGVEPVPFQLKAASPVYFSPSEGVKSAPLELVREVTLQMKGKLRR